MTILCSLILTKTTFVFFRSSCARNGNVQDKKYYSVTVNRAEHLSNASVFRVKSRIRFFLNLDLKFTTVDTIIQDTKPMMKESTRDDYQCSEYWSNSQIVWPQEHKGGDAGPAVVGV